MTRDRKEYARKYYQANKERIKEQHGEKKKAYQQKNAEHFKELKKRYLKNNIPQRLFEYAARRSKQRDLEFDITVQDILDVWTDVCPIFKEPLTDTYGSGLRVRSPYNYSIDRIDSSKGYVRGNIQILSYKANLIKSDATPEELVKFAKGVLEMFHEI